MSTTRLPAHPSLFRKPRYTSGLAGAVLLLALILSGCATSSTPPPAYGGTQNHVHDVLALQGMPRTVLLATHIGLYRSDDAGHTWAEVAGGSGQVMDGLMIFKLAQSPVNVRRVYVLATPRPDDPQAARDVPGIYTSADAGTTWKLATPLSAFPTHNVFTIGIGTNSADEVYAVVPALAEKGLYVSRDDGMSWNALPTLPASSISGVTGDPSHPGRVVLWSLSSGLFLSDNDGQSWKPAPGIQGGVFSLALAGPTVYADGDSGIHRSDNDGGSFTLVNADATFSAVMASASDPRHAYGLTGTAIYGTSDAGKTWTPTAATSQHPTTMTVDPDNAATAYVGLSYPLGVDATTDAGVHWTRVLP